MKEKFILIVICILLFNLVPSNAYADIGPKPSVVVNFEGLEGETYYVTLLSEKISTGPYSAVGRYDGDQRYWEEDEDFDIWEKFVNYEDEDGYYFLQYFKNCTESSQFSWTYYPPPLFKILVYFPQYDSFAVSSIYDRYAFDSYYKVTANNLEFKQSSTIEITAQKNYNYSKEVFSLIVRIIITIAIEVLLALIFGYREKKQLSIILKTNIATQTILNVFLNTVNYFSGGMAFVLFYILGEIIVVLIEITIYSKLLTKHGSGRLTKKPYAVFYALTANIISFAAGLYISILIPGIF